MTTNSTWGGRCGEGLPSAPLVMTPGISSRLVGSGYASAHRRTSSDSSASAPVAPNVCTWPSLTSALGSRRRATSSATVDFAMLEYETKDSTL